MNKNRGRRRTVLEDLSKSEQFVSEREMFLVKGGKEPQDGVGSPPKPENKLCSAAYCSKTAGHSGPHGKDTSL